MSEPIADALLTFNGKEIGLTNSSGFLNYSCPDAGRHMINASKTGYRSASKVLVVQENSSASPVRSTVSESSSYSDDKNVTRSETQTPGFRVITIFLILAFFVLRRSSL
jgi:TolB protein